MVNAGCVGGSRATLSIAVKLLLVAGLLISTAAGVSAAPTAAQRTAQTAEQPPAGPHLLIQNVGQYAAEARFLLRQGDRRIWLTADAIWLTVPDPLSDSEEMVRPNPELGPVGRQRHAAAVARPGTAIRFSFPGGNPAPTIEPYGTAPTRLSYLIGNDPARWQRNVPVWSGVRYRELYPGIDLVIGDSATGAVPWRLEARPGADLNMVHLRTEGAGAVVAEAGALRLELKEQMLELTLPTWSIEGQADRVISTAGQQETDTFVLAPSSVPQSADGSVSALAAGDLIYNTPVGGSLYDAGYAIAADAQGNTYITGETLSTDLPLTTGPFDPTNSGGTPPTDAFVAKLDATGTTLLYLTYLGGSALDLGWGIAVSGDLAFVTGETASADFPGMTGTVSGVDLFVAAFTPDGSDVRYVSRLGGTASDRAYGIAVEGLDAYVVGSTNSSGAGLNCSAGVNGDLLVAKFDALGSKVYATCLLSSDAEIGYGIAVLNGVAYVTGETIQATRDMIVARFDINGMLAGGREVEGSGNDWGAAIAVDKSGNMYVIGTTSSTNFPITANTAPWGGGNTDAVVLQLHFVDTSLVIDFATYLGGDGDEEGKAIAVDTVQGLYVTGMTTSSVFPMTNLAYATSPFGSEDVFAARMHRQSATADKVTYASYLGAAYEDWGYGIATDTGGHVFVAGSSANTADWLTANAFVAKLKVSSPPAAPVISAAKSGTSVLLTWSTVPTASKYQVFGSTAPYFQASDWNSSLRQELNTLSFTDVNVLNSAGAYFYLVKAVDATPAASANSNRKGKITYQLVKGTP